MSRTINMNNNQHKLREKKTHWTKAIYMEIEKTKAKILYKEQQTINRI